MDSECGPTCLTTAGAVMEVLRRAHVRLLRVIESTHLSHNFQARARGVSAYGSGRWRERALLAPFHPLSATAARHDAVRPADCGPLPAKLGESRRADIRAE